MSATDRWAMPHLLPGQSQKELFHNKSLQVLDLIVSAAVEEPPRAAPPSVPVVGSCYIVAPLASGAWVGHADCLAGMTAAGWQFVTPIEGFAVFIRSSWVTAVFRLGSWELGTLRGERVEIDGQQVIGPRGPAIAAPTAGSVIDTEARSIIAAMLSALRQHGLIAT